MRVYDMRKGEGVREVDGMNLYLYFCSTHRPENVPRLFDLVRPKDAKFLTAFYFGLKDTLVADTLDQATRIGLQVICVL